MYVKNGHKTYVQDKCISNRKKRKRYKKILTTSLDVHTPPNYDYSHIQNCSPFLSRVTKGKSVK